MKLAQQDRKEQLEIEDRLDQQVSLDWTVLKVTSENVERLILVELVDLLSSKPMGWWTSCHAVHLSPGDVYLSEFSYLRRVADLYRREARSHICSYNLLAMVAEIFNSPLT